MTSRAALVSEALSLVCLALRAQLVADGGLRDEHTRSAMARVAAASASSRGPLPPSVSSHLYAALTRLGVALSHPDRRRPLADAVGNLTQALDLLDPPPQSPAPVRWPGWSVGPVVVDELQR